MADQKSPPISLDLTEDELTAGREYLASLKALGLDPEGLMWALDEENRRHVLMLYTSFVDTVGTLEIYNLLFKAYDAAATPESVSPFIVELRSPKQNIYKEICNFYKNTIIHNTEGVRFVDGFGRKLTTKEALSFSVGHNYIVIGLGVYQARQPRSADVDVSRRWQRFRRHVEDAVA